MDGFFQDSVDIEDAIVKQSKRGPGRRRDTRSARRAQRALEEEEVAKMGVIQANTDTLSVMSSGRSQTSGGASVANTTASGASQATFKRRWTRSRRLQRRRGPDRPVSGMKARVAVAMASSPNAHYWPPPRPLSPAREARPDFHPSKFTKAYSSDNARGTQAQQKKAPRHSDSEYFLGRSDQDCGTSVEESNESFRRDTLDDEYEYNYDSDNIQEAGTGEEDDDDDDGDDDEHESTFDQGDGFLGNEDEGGGNYAEDSDLQFEVEGQVTPELFDVSEGSESDVPPRTGLGAFDTSRSRSRDSRRLRNTLSESANKQLRRAFCRHTVRDWIASSNVELSFRKKGLPSIEALQRIANNPVARARLRILDLDWNVLTRLPNKVIQLSSLVELHIEHNRLRETSFPADMGQMTSLTSLCASHNHIQKFPLAFATLPAVEFLDLHHNEISCLTPIDPEEKKVFCDKLKSTLGNTLRSLDLGMNNLQGVLEEQFFSDLERLEQLSVHTNKLTALPRCFKSLLSLRSLRANGNPLQRPPLLIVAGGMQSVRAYLEKVPDVDVDSESGAEAQTDDIANESSQSTQQSLPLAEEKDAEDQGCLNLPKRSSSNGDVVSPPSSAVAKGSVNAFERSPVSDGGSEANLLDMAVQGIVSISESVVASDTAEVSASGTLSLDSTVQETSSSSASIKVKSPTKRSPRPRNFKIVVLGHEAAGKTSLIQTLISGTGKTTDVDARTFGVDIHTCDLPALGDATVGQTAMLWDFAGQSVYYRSHQLFLSRRTLYLVVWDVNEYSVAELDARVCFWIYSIQARVPGAVILIIASKADTISPEQLEERKTILLQRLEQHETWQKNDLQAMIYEEEHDAHTAEQESSMSVTSGRSRFLPSTTTFSIGGFQETDDVQKNELGTLPEMEYHDMRPQVLLRQRPHIMSEIVSVSSYENMGFDHLRTTLARIVCDETLFPHMGALAQIPRSWDVVEQAVAALRSERVLQPVCMWEELVDRVATISEKEGVAAEEGDIQDCANFLNDIGDIVYNRGPDNMLFLDSKWIVDCIKRVVDHNIVAKLSRGARREQMRSRGAILTRETIISRDVQHLKEKSILCETLVANLWPELFEERRGKLRVKSMALYDGLFSVLEQFDVCSPLPSRPDGTRRWLIPSLISNPVNLKKHWPRLNATRQDDNQTLEIGVSFVFTRFQPPGLMAKVLMRISELFDSKRSEMRTWQDATIIRVRLENRQQIKLLLHIQQESTASYNAGDTSEDWSDTGEDSFDQERAVFSVSARGEQSSLYEMWQRVTKLKDVIESILIEEYMGITWVYLVRCPVCVSLLRPDQAVSMAHSFQLIDVESFAESVSEDFAQDWKEIMQADSRGDGGSTLSWSSLSQRLCTMMCEVHSGDIIDHETPLVWLLPPPFSREEVAIKAKEERMGNLQLKYDLEDKAQLPARLDTLPRPYSFSDPHHPHELCLASGTVLDLRAVCRIGILSKQSLKFKEQGTGFIMDRERGLIATACHLITDPNTLQRKFDFGPSSTVRLLIGCFATEDTLPPWRYEAEVVLSGEAQEPFLDFLVLRVTHSIQEVSRSGPSSSVFGFLDVQRTGNVSLPLDAEISLGNSDEVRIGHPVSLLGFPLGRGETICVDHGRVVGFEANKTAIHATPFNHDGSSGGPLVDKHGLAVGIMSKATSGGLGIHLASKLVLPLLEKAFPDRVWLESRGT